MVRQKRVLDIGLYECLFRGLEKEKEQKPRAAPTFFFFFWFFHPPFYNHYHQRTASVPIMSKNTSTNNNGDIPDIIDNVDYESMPHPDKIGTITNPKGNFNPTIPDILPHEQVRANKIQGPIMSLIIV